MKIAATVARILLGLVFLVFGLNGFLNFLPVPPMPEKAGAFLGAMVGTGYLLTVVKVVEVVCGALLLSGYFVPLALVLLSPVVVNIFLFHAFLTPPKDAIGAVVFLGLTVFLMWYHRDSYRPLFVPRPSKPLARV
jgi:uncharacterized membrane protein YphA (DoxX/SURF4 family)